MESKEKYIWPTAGIESKLPQRHYIADHRHNWDLFTESLTYGDNTKPHTSTKIAAFELVLSRAPPAFAVDAEPKVAEVPVRAHYAFKWQKWFISLMWTATYELAKRQKRYRKKFGLHLRPLRGSIGKGSHVLLRKEYWSKKNAKRKLVPAADGPYKFIDVKDKTFLSETGDDHERISGGDVVWAQSPVQ